MAFVIPAGTGITLADSLVGFLKKSGTTAIASGTSPPTVVILGADQTNSTTSFADVTGLSFSVAAATKYLIYTLAIFQTDTVTTGIKFSLNGPAAASLILFNHSIPTATTSALNRSGRAFDTTAASTGIDIINTSTLITLDAIFVNGANAGTLSLRFASEVDTSVVTVKAGSVLVYQVVA